MDTPSQATLLLMTYPLSMESVKVYLELSLFVHPGCLCTSLTVETFLTQHFKNVQLVVRTRKAEIKIVSPTV